jgi:hypothetical protein
VRTRNLRLPNPKKSGEGVDPMNDDIKVRIQELREKTEEMRGYL